MHNFIPTFVLSFFLYNFYMKIIKTDKNNRDDKLIDALVDVWEGSVLVTHLFLSKDEIEKIKLYIPNALRKIENLLVVINDDNHPIAFMGIENQKLEMLFVSAKERNNGIGTKLIQLGIKDYLIKELTVNEQNPNAKRFYENNGFRVYKRTQTDEQGNPYPLLYMKLY